MRNSILTILAILLVFACAKKPQDDFENSSAEVEGEGEFVEYNNPPAEGFNMEESDMLAMLLADKAMLAMGGREAWDKTRFLTWNFFGRRKHTWDKMTGDVRIENTSGDLVILMNINSKQGKVRKDGEVLSQPDSLTKYLTWGYEAWVNDSYWVFMPFKMKDSGVTLSYLGDDTTQAGKMADVIRMSFEEVGVTPENIYNVWIDVDTKLVTQWAYYPNIDAEEPRFINPWNDYQKYGDILLSGDRGRAQITDIDVLEDVPEGTFVDFDVEAL